MIYTTFEQIEYGFVLLDINKKHLDINRFWKYKIWQGLPKWTFTVQFFLAYFESQYFIIYNEFWIFFCILLNLIVGANRILF